MAVEYILSLAAALISSAITVFFRDMQHILGIISMAWMYLTPIMYPVEIVPEKYRLIFYLNPMTPIIVAYRDILYAGQIPKMTTLIHAFAMGLVLLCAGMFIFGKLKNHFAEEM
jgi:ABC-2 type transport system permease protein